jgi:DNA mismatch endonuclease (patch repair protein)
MPDVFTKEKRSAVMSRIRGKRNRDTELLFAKLLRKHGISGWRRHAPIIGRPDFVFRIQRSQSLSTVVFGTAAQSIPTCR